MSRQNLFLIFLGFIYYLFFINKGIVLYDEGYYFHIADRILQGQVPYKDFFLQFSPGYFYLLALILKIFGEQILVGRFLTLFICLCILFLELKVSEKLGLSKIYQKIIIFLATISFGFPLINNVSLLAWISVLFSLLIVFSFISKKYIFLGVFLSLLLLTKQNLGLYLLLITNLFLIFGKVIDNSKFKVVILVNGIVLGITLLWISYFFLLQSNINRFFEFITFNSRYLSIYPFSYPSLTFLLQLDGIFKLLPYYLPIIFIPFLIKEFFNKKGNINVIYFSTISLIGFFGTVFPTSDLLHVYPFFGMFLISSLVFFYKNKYFRYWRILVLILIAIGFYLTLFKEYYRYQPQYRYQKILLDFPRTQNIMIDKPLADDLDIIKIFFNVYTKKGDYILSYPFSPMLYFISERNNPSRYSIYYPGYLTNQQEKDVISEIKSRNVKYIITRSEYKFNNPLSKYIQSQKIVYSHGDFNILKIK